MVIFRISSEVVIKAVLELYNHQERDAPVLAQEH